MTRRGVVGGRAVTARGPALIRLYAPHYGVMPNASAFAASLRSYAESFGFSCAIKELCRLIRHNSSYVASNRCAFPQSIDIKETVTIMMGGLAGNLYDAFNDLG